MGKWSVKLRTVFRVYECEIRLGFNRDAACTGTYSIPVSEQEATLRPHEQCMKCAFVTVRGLYAESRRLDILGLFEVCG